MKKRFFFLIFILIFPLTVEASSYLKDFQVKNGQLLSPFTEKNNIYTIKLEEDQTVVEFEYTKEDQTKIEVIGNQYQDNQENVMIIKVMNEQTQESETYTFYLEKEKTSPSAFAFTEENKLEVTPKEIPYLKPMIITICSLLILIIFKLLILNFFKKDEKKTNHLHKT